MSVLALTPRWTKWVLVGVALWFAGAGLRSVEAGPADREASLRLAQASGDALARDSMLALLLAREAYGLDRSAQTRSTLYSALARTYEHALLRGHEGPLTSIDIAGDVVATGSEDGTARLWNRAGEALATLEVGRTLQRVVLLDRGATLLTVSDGEAGEGASLHLFEDGEAKQLAEGLAADAFAVSPAKNALLVSSTPDTWTLLDGRGKPKAELAGTTVSFDPKGLRCLARAAGTDVALHEVARRRKVVLKDTKDATAAMLDATGTRVLVYAPGTTAHLFDVAGTLVATLEHDSPIERACFSPADGSLLVATRDAFVRWSTSGTRLARVEKSAPADVLQFSNDGRWFVTVTAGTELTLWLTKDTERFASTRLGERARAVTVHSKGMWITAHLESGRYAFFGVKLNEQYALGSPQRTVGLSVLDPWERWDLNAGEDGVVALINFVSQQPIWLLGHTDAVVDAVFTEDGFIATASKDGTARLWAMHQEGTPVLGGHRSAVYGGAFLDALDRVVTMAHGDSFLWDLEGRPVAHVYHPDLPAWWAYAPNAFAVVVREHPEVRVFDGSARRTHTLDHGAVVTGVSFLPDGERLLSWSARQRTVRVWDRKGKLLGTAQPDDEVLLAVFATRDSVALLGPARRMRMFSIQGKELARWDLPEDAEELSRAGDGSHFWIRAKDGSVARLFDEDGKQVAVVDDHVGPITSVDLAAKQALLLSGSQDGVVKIHDLEGTLLVEVEHPGPVTSVSFFPGDERFGTACEDGGLRIYETDGTPWAQLQRHRDGLMGFHFSKEGARVLTLSKDLTAGLWPATDDGLTKTLQARVRRDFTPAERADYEALLRR